jgi:hydroxyacid-oxoacid transhydrogenase
VDHPIVPHGISVALTGPSVFDYTSPSSPDRHREVARIFNTFQPDSIQEDRVSDADIGKLLRDRISRFLVGIDVPRGLNGIGCVEWCFFVGQSELIQRLLGIRYKSEHIPELVKGTLPQRRVLDLAPGFSVSNSESEDHLSKILEDAMSF